MITKFSQSNNKIKLISDFCSIPVFHFQIKIYESTLNFPLLFSKFKRNTEYQELLKIQCVKK